MSSDKLSPLLFQQFLARTWALYRSVCNFLKVLISEAFYKIKLILEDHDAEKGSFAGIYCFSCHKFAYFSYFSEQWLQQLQISVKRKHFKCAINWIFSFFLLYWTIGMDGIVDGGMYFLCRSVSLVVDGQSASVRFGNYCRVVLSEMVLIFVVFFSQHHKLYYKSTIKSLMFENSPPNRLVLRCPEHPKSTLTYICT